jgi:ATP-binding cassette subfamily B protein
MKIIQIFKRYIKGHRISLSMSLALVIFLNYFRSLIPLFIGKAFAILDGNPDSSLPSFINAIFLGRDVAIQLLLVAIAIVVTALIRDTLNLFTDLFIANTSEGIGYNLQTDFYKRVGELPYSYLNQAETGDLIQRSISDINRVKRFIGGSLPQIFSSAIQILIYAGQMLLINLTYSSIVLITVPILFTIAVTYFRKMHYAFEDIEQKEGKLTTIVQENLTGIRVVKAFANEEYEINKFNNGMKAFLKSWDHLMNKMSSYWGFSDGYSYAVMLLGFALGIIFILNGDLVIGEAISLFLFVQNIIWPTRVLGRQIGELSRSDTAGKRIMEIIDIPTEFEKDDGTLTPKIEGSIEFRDVSFKFNDAKTPTIHNINLSIKAGETVALIGKTGSGKSTLVSMLNRMIDHTDGELLIDGIDIKQINKKYLRKNVGMVLQEPFLFSRSIAENIGVVRSTIDLNEIKSVAEIAAVRNDIEHFEKGFDTLVGERGVTLSGGQKQRIAIARTLLENYKILVFDDSLSAVDTETDLRIRRALAQRQNHSTTIIITHRVTTAMDADRIIVIENGSISEVGTHDELVRKEGLYRKIWSIQTQFSGPHNYIEEVIPHA